MTSQTITIILIILLLVIIPAIVGGWLARQRGRSPLFWGAACGLFPIFLLVSWYNKPLREVPGGFKRCPNCQEWLRWRDSLCKYCRAELPAHES